MDRNSSRNWTSAPIFGPRRWRQWCLHVCFHSTHSTATSSCRWGEEWRSVFFEASTLRTRAHLPDPGGRCHIRSPPWSWWPLSNCPCWTFWCAHPAKRTAPGEDYVCSSNPREKKKRNFFKKVNTETKRSLISLIKVTTRRFDHRRSELLPAGCRRSILVWFYLWPTRCVRSRPVCQPEPPDLPSASRQRDPAAQACIH